MFFATAWVWTMSARVRTAAEWAGAAGTLVGVTAAWWWGFEVASPHPVTVVFPPGRPRAGPPGITSGRRELAGDRERHRGLWVTGRALTVLDTAVLLGRDGQAFLDRALQQHVTLDELRVTQNRHLGRRGSPAAGDLVARAGDRAVSEPERRMLALLRRAGITGWTVNLDIVLSTGRTAVLDVAFPELRLAVEVDGWAHHVDVDRFVRDRVRKRALVADGWTVIEVTWDDLVHRPDRVLDELRRILLRLSAA